MSLSRQGSRENLGAGKKPVATANRGGFAALMMDSDGDDDDDDDDDDKSAKSGKSGSEESDEDDAEVCMWEVWCVGGVAKHACRLCQSHDAPTQKHHSNRQSDQV